MNNMPVPTRMVGWRPNEKAFKKVKTQEIIHLLFTNIFMYFPDFFQ